MTIKELREKNKLTQAAFADALGVTGKYIYLIESGKSNLSKKLSDKIAEVYGEVIEPAEKKVKTAAVKAEKKAKTTAAKAEKKADKAAADAAQAVLDAEKKIDKKKRKARSKAQADKPAVEAVAEAIAAPVEAAAKAAAAPIEAVKEKKARRRAKACNEHRDPVSPRRRDHSGGNPRQDRGSRHGVCPRGSEQGLLG